MASQRDCELALDAFEQDLSRRRHVVGLGIAEREPSGGKTARRGLAVTVYVSRKLPPSELAPDERIPETLHVVRKGKTINVPTQVVEQGTVQLESVLGKEAL